MRIQWYKKSNTAVLHAIPIFPHFDSRHWLKPQNRVELFLFCLELLLGNLIGKCN